MQHQGRLVFFFWHLLFDNLKLTDTAERFITFSPFVSCMLNNLHGSLYRFVWSLLDILRNIHPSPPCQNKFNLLSYVCERIHPSFAFIMLFFIRVPNNCFFYVWKSKTRFFCGWISIRRETALIYIPTPAYPLLCTCIKCICFLPAGGLISSSTSHHIIFSQDSS